MARFGFVRSRPPPPPPPPTPPPNLCSIVILVGILKSIYSQCFDVCCVLIVERSWHLRVSKILTSSPPFWVVTPRICLVIYRRLGTTHQVPSSRVKQSKKNASFAKEKKNSLRVIAILFFPHR